MDKRWQLSFDGGTTYVDCNPLNGGSLSIDQARDLEKGQIFFRDVLSGALKFGGDDYASINEWRRQPPQRCQPIYVRLQLRCGGIWQTRWTGSFAASSGKWNLSRCQVEVKPNTVDRYSCLLDKAKVKANLLLRAPVTIQSGVMPSIRFGMSYFDGENDTFVTYNVLLDNDGNPTSPGWALQGYEYIDPNGPYNVRLWWREEIFTDCLEGIPQTPPGTGWTMLVDFCDSPGPFEGTSFWVRTPLFSYTISSLILGTCGDGDTDIPPDPSTCPGGQLIIAQPCGFLPSVIPGTSTRPRYVCFRGIQQTYTRGRTNQASIEQVLSTVGCDTMGVRSDFFEINPPGDAPGYAENINYVTGDTNQVNHLIWMQKSDAKAANATNPATIGEITFEEMMSIFRNAFRVFWDIDSDGYLRIEHWTYWRFGVGVDLGTVDNLVELMTYGQNDTTIPGIERASFMEAALPDFVGKDILYSGPCVDSEEVLNISIGRVTTDVYQVLTDPDSVSREGWFLFATAEAGGDLVNIIDIGAISGDAVTNAPLSLANLQDAFWRNDRLQPTGNMNGQDVTFPEFMPTIEQEPVSFTYCCEVLSFDPKKKIAGSLSASLGVDGTIQSTSWSIKSNRLSLNIAYPF